MADRAQAGDAFTMRRWWRAQDNPSIWYSGPAWECDEDREDAEIEQLDRERPAPPVCGGSGVTWTRVPEVDKEQ